jgi:hypothetical protein
MSGKELDQLILRQLIEEPVIEICRKLEMPRNK